MYFYNQKTEITTYRALVCVLPLGALGHDGDLLTPKIDLSQNASTLKSLVKFTPVIFKISHQTVHFPAVENWMP